MADFDVAAVGTLFAAIASMVKELGVFKMVIRHEPKSVPTSLPAAALWWQRITPVRSSGLASVSGSVVFNIRVYQAKMTQEPQDGIDPALLKNTALILRALAGGFTLGGAARGVDLLGAEGTQLDATSGFISHDGSLLRVAQITVPVIVNDLWSEVA